MFSSFIHRCTIFCSRGKKRGVTGGSERREREKSDSFWFPPLARRAPRPLFSPTCSRSVASLFKMLTIQMTKYYQQVTKTTLITTVCIKTILSTEFKPVEPTKMLLCFAIMESLCKEWKILVDKNNKKNCQRIESKLHRQSKNMETNIQVNCNRNCKKFLQRK